MRKNSVKHERVNQAVQKELSNIIRNEIKDPRVGIMTSVTAVDVATDLKTCKVYISVLGDENAKEETMKALDKAEGFIRKALASNLNMRNTPKLTFIADNSIEYGVKMSAMINEVMEKDAEKESKSGEEDE
jgi:ribosome-binding factor A